MNWNQLWAFLNKVQPLMTFFAGFLGLIVGAFASRRLDKLRQLEAIRASA